MNFNHDSGLIDSLLTIDTTVAPPLGGTTNSLVIQGSGSLYLPQGNDGARPANATGQIRYNTTSNLVEFNNGSGWNTLSVGGSGVTSVAVTGSTGLAVSGSPITGAGTITLTLDSGLQSLSSLAPTFRQLTFADLSATAIKLYAENPSSPTAPSATGTNAVALGSGAAASGTGSLAVGAGASATLYGQVANANGSFATAGDAQQSIFVLRNSTTNATQTELFLDGSSARMVLPNNSLWTFSIFIGGRRTDATGGGAGYKVEGVIRRDGTAASTTLTGVS